MPPRRREEGLFTGFAGFYRVCWLAPLAARAPQCCRNCQWARYLWTWGRSCSESLTACPGLPRSAAVAASSRWATAWPSPAVTYRGRSSVPGWCQRSPVRALTPWRGAASSSIISLLGRATGGDARNQTSCCATLFRAIPYREDLSARSRIKLASDEDCPRPRKSLSRCGAKSEHHLLDFIQTHYVRSTVIQSGRPRALMHRHQLPPHRL